MFIFTVLDIRQNICNCILISLDYHLYVGMCGVFYSKKDHTDNFARNFGVEVEKPDILAHFIP